MSRIYLVRHGQAGTRHSYDSLSDLGHRQAKLLGKHFVERGFAFSAAYTGALIRQRETASAVAAAYSEAGVHFPSLRVEPSWNEFDLDHVYRELSAVLCEEDPEFRRDFEAMHAELKAAEDQADADVHRRWMPSDLRIVQAWVKGHPRYRGETWLAFHERIRSCRALIPVSPSPSHYDDNHNIAIFTSATPIGIWAALSLDVDDHRAMRLAGVLMNASYTVMRLRGEQLRLHTFNAVPNFEPGLCSYR